MEAFDPISVNDNSVPEVLPARDGGRPFEEQGEHNGAPLKGNHGNDRMVVPIPEEEMRENANYRD